MRWNLLGRALRLGFLLRIPLTTMLLLFILGPLAASNSLIDNLLDLGPRPLDAFIVSFSAFLLAFTAIATLNLILYYGSDRLDECRTVEMCPRHPLFTFIAGTLAATVFMCFVTRRTEHDWRITAAFAMAGVIAAFALVVIAKLVQLWLTDPKD